MTKEAAKILSEYRRLSPEEKEEVFGAIVSEPRTPKRRAELEHQPFYVRNQQELKAAVQIGLDQADRGETVEFNAQQIKAVGREALKNRF